MPRKKQPESSPELTPIENLTAKKTRKKPTKSEAQDDIATELKELVSEDVNLVFRSRATEAKKPESVKAVTTAPKKLVEATEDWDEDLPIPAFRERTSEPKLVQETVQQQPRESKKQERPVRTPKSLKPSLEPIPAEPDVQEKADRSELVEFEPTATLEFDDDGEMVLVKMRTKVEVERPAPRQPKTRITPRETANEETSLPVAKAPEKVVIPPRALIEIPEDAPQVVVRNGKPTLVRDTKVYPNFWFYASPQDAERTEIVLGEIKQASEAGVNIYALGFDATTDERHFDALHVAFSEICSKIVKINPSAQIVLSLNLIAQKGWEIEFNEGLYRDRSGDLAEPSVSDTKYWNSVEKLLVALTEKLAKSELNPNILGIDLNRDGWRIPEKASLDISQASKRKFREWIKERYQNDVVLLRASWFDGTADFDTIRIPDLERKPNEDRMVRSQRRERSVVDYCLFLSDQTVTVISNLAFAVKEASKGRFIVGVHYGEMLEDVNPTSGHLALGKILRTPEIDFVTSAPSYRDRNPGGTAAFSIPIDSFALNGKLLVSLEDYKTSLANRPEPDQHNPVMRTPQALESVHLRGIGAALAHHSGISWSDQWGNGWLTASSVWSRAKTLQAMLVQSMAADNTDPEVAVFVDERALGYLVGTKAFAELVRKVRNSVLRAGVSCGIYLLSDLAHREKFPESKLSIFLNAWDIRPDLRSAVKSRLHRNGKTLFWIYGAALFDSGRETLERAREVTGIALKPQPIFSQGGTSILDRRNPIAQAFSSGTITPDHTLEPTYFAIPENGTVLGEYHQTGLPSFVVRDIQGEEKGQDWSSVFLGETDVNPALIRALAQKAGAHIWSFSEDVVHVRAPYLTVHCVGDGQRTIALPGKWSAYNLQTKEWAVIDSTHLKFSSPDGVTHNFLVGTTETLRQILESNPRDLLRMTELPARESNVRIDISNFDVPIMRLDEWANESAEMDDTGIDSYFLKTQEEDDYEEDASLAPGAIQRTTGRRRKDRRDRRNRRKESFADQVDFEPTGEEKLKDKSDVELNILFRSRD